MTVNGLKIEPCANLADAYLSGADLRGAYLSGADLRGADLRGADLSGVDLSGADLRGANLADANLADANLRCANLADAYLADAYLTGAHLADAHLTGAHLAGAHLSPGQIAMFTIVAAGEIEVWKRVQRHLIKLQVPAEARRVGGLTGRKCRCEFALVVSIDDPEGNPIESVVGGYDPEFIYRVGDIVRPNRYEDDPRLECAPGIHFFITKSEALSYD